jgi:hypothetical protein
MMTYDTTEWACSELDGKTLDREIAKFLRTHRDGAGTLLELLSSVPADRTEGEYRATRALALV